MPNMSSRTKAIPLSGIREMMDLALATPGVLRLEIGDPDFRTPDAITAAACAWAAENRMSYPPNSGLPELRAAAARKVSRVNGFACEAANVNVTIGATGALYLALLAAIEPGDEVLVPDPGWAGYPAMVALAGGVFKAYPLRAENGFRLDFDDVAPLVGPRTRAIIVNSPSNPTGAVNDAAELRKLIAHADRHGVWVIADECYDEVVFDGTSACVGTLAPLEGSPVLSAFSLSKTYAMTGWRVGYLVAPKDISAQVTRMQAASVASAAVIAQRAALAALEGPQDASAAMIVAYRRRRDVATALLDAAAIPYIRPQGAMYVFVDIRAAGLSSRDFALTLLREKAVCTTPGDAFGTNGEGFVRVSLACADADLAEGLSRLGQFVAARR
ncbi:MAG: aminotransferase class I/II-fold pyridoxal phosphate-dependent enzyme [Rhizobiaceae bacterium]|nr:aminotransferase class I/II-fold pyridoxal phosphate-dependent enzyme [Rhizobiaceae bacterium]